MSYLSSALQALAACIPRAFLRYNANQVYSKEMTAFLGILQALAKGGNTPVSPGKAESKSSFALYMQIKFQVSSYSIAYKPLHLRQSR